MTKAKHAHSPLSNVLASRIQTLQDLLKRLPESLPLNPAETTYQFFIDPDDLEEGKEYALRRRLELAFPDTWQQNAPRGRAIQIRERGRRLDTDLIKFLRENLRDIPEAERGLFQDIWVDRLILAAKEAGAKPRKRAVADSEDEGDVPIAGVNPTRKRPKQTTLMAHLSTGNVDKPPGITFASTTAQETPQSDGLGVIVISDTDDEDYEPEHEEPTTPCHASLPKAPNKAAKPPRRRPRAPSPSPSPSDPSEATKQRTLFDVGCKTCTPDEAADQRKEVDRKLARLGAADRQRALERAKELEEEKKERERTLGRDRQRKFRERRAQEKRPAGGQAGKQAKLAVLGYASDTPIAEVAGISRPEGQAWRKRRPGTEGGKKAAPATRTNYYHPFLSPCAVGRV
ncbi:hypothetical protein K523DRAFT_358957 [Schizophyllum commune Tattone D]|nr:hypothetical protein K523DRAFT_358957 [Schizophyllum commune Tattone D]